MIQNNRQQNRNRNRGRRPQNNGGRNENGSRIDSRARGNAPQLLEKYKNMARDSQMQGDRVMTEYYLQFADHYFRIVAEQRVKAEENRRPREDWQSDEDFDGEDRGQAEALDGEEQLDGDDQGVREPRNRDRDRPRERGNDRNQDRSTQDRNNPDRNRNRDRNFDRNRDRNRGGENAGNRADRGDEEQVPSAEDGRIDVAVLPPGFVSDGPMIAIDDIDVAPSFDEAPAPKRRGRPRKVVVADEAV